MPVVEVGEATWSPEHSAWFVKCRMSQTKQWQLAVRKDNPANRWQEDGESDPSRSVQPDKQRKQDKVRLLACEEPS